MRAEKLISVFVLLFTNFYSNLYSQESVNSEVSLNRASAYETERINYFIPNEMELLALEKQHKKLLEENNERGAGLIKNQIDNITDENSKLITDFSNSGVKAIQTKNNVPSGDWLSVNSTVHIGSLITNPGYHKKFDLKVGDDNILYSGVSYYSSPLSYLVFYKSTNSGLNWSMINGVGISGKHISSVSLLVESKNNAVPDSTRLLLFYTASGSGTYESSSIGVFSCRVDGNSYSVGTFAYPSAGNTFGHLSAVSDGAFYQGATYFGVICNELDNTSQSVQNIRFFRSVDWGVSWSASVLSTTFNDFYPSADFKRGSPDSICIAVERRFSATESEVRLLTTSWVPSNNFRTGYITNTPGAKFEKPSLTIKQNSPVDSMLIICTKNSEPFYHYSVNSGGTWIINNAVDPLHPANVNFTHCASSKSGNSTFTMIWQSNDGDSVNTRRGEVGNFGTPKYKLNSNRASGYITSLCATLNTNGINTSGLIYCSNSPTGIFFNQENVKKLTVVIIPEGNYNQSTNMLNSNDTITVNIRHSASPYNIAESSTKPLYSSSMRSYHIFQNLEDGDYYIDVNHRNSIQTFSNGTVSFGAAGDLNYDFTTSASQAYGNNMRQVDSAPVRFAAYSGDVNQDGVVDATDAGTIDNAAFNFSSGYVVTDLTGDNLVDASDAAIADNNVYNFVSKIVP